MIALLVFIVLWGGTAHAGGVEATVDGKKQLVVEHRCEFAPAEVSTSKGESLRYEPVVCATRVRVGSKITVTERTLGQLACTKSGKPWVIGYWANATLGLGKDSQVYSRRVLIDLWNHSWMILTVRWDGNRIVRAVREHLEECPSCRRADLVRYLEKKGMLRSVWEVETDQVEVPEIHVEGSGAASDKQMLKWRREVLEPTLMKFDPHFCETRQELADAIRGASDPDGHLCWFQPSLLPFLLPESQVKVVRECEEFSAAHYVGQDSAWPEFWDKFSKWDTWPEFPNMKRFRF